MWATPTDSSKSPRASRNCARARILSVRTLNTLFGTRMTVCSRIGDWLFWAAAGNEQAKTIAVTDAAFNPYHKWLGIRDIEHPPNHYRLLGLDLFEDDADAIANAADRQMAHVRKYQLGPHADASQRLLNVSAGASN